MTAVPVGPPVRRTPRTPVRVPLRKVLADGRWALRFTCAHRSRAGRPPRRVRAREEPRPGRPHRRVRGPRGRRLGRGRERSAARIRAGCSCWVGAALGLSVLGGLTKIAERHASRRLLDELEVRLTGDILEHAASLDVACFEDPASLDLLERARRDPAASFHLFLLNALHVLGDGLQGLTLAVVLAVVEPWLLVPLVVLAAAVRPLPVEDRRPALRPGDAVHHPPPLEPVLRSAPHASAGRDGDQAARPRAAPPRAVPHRGVAVSRRELPHPLAQLRSSARPSSSSRRSPSSRSSLTSGSGSWRARPRSAASSSSRGPRPGFGRWWRRRSPTSGPRSNGGSSSRTFAPSSRSGRACTPGGGRPVAIQGAADVELDDVTFTYPGAPRSRP